MSDQKTLTGRKPVSQLPTRPQARPVLLSSSDRCAECQTPAGSKAGSWYSIGGGKYCQDCASTAAYKAKVDLTADIPAKATAATRLNIKFPGQFEGKKNGASRRTTAPPLDGGLPQATSLPTERGLATQLAPNRIGLAVGRQGTPVIAQGYVLLGPNSRRGPTPTGLAITPAIEKKDGEFYENPERWSITHISSGRALTDAVYSLDDAQNLGSVLAQLDWTPDQDELPLNNLYRAKVTVQQYNEMLAASNQVDQSRSANVEARSPLPQPQQSKRASQAESDILPRPTQQVPAPSIAGKLVADGYGGLARVVEDKGETLFLIDSVGTRYELPRNQTRAPDTWDFEVNRVAQSFDPARTPAAGCTRCGNSAAQAADGDNWYQMNRQSFCGACATEYAAEEGYLKEDEINTELEPMVG